MSRPVAGWCLECHAWPCVCRQQPVNELSDGLEWRADALAVWCRRLYVAFREHLMSPKHLRSDCVSCGQMLEEAERAFKEMDVP